MNIDVILLTYGEPAEPSFIDQWRYSNRILYKLTRLVAPIPKIVVPLVGAWRGYGRMKTWKTEHYNSPLASITVQQAKSVQKSLLDRNDENNWRVHIAYEFRDPSLDNILTHLIDQSCERLIFVPMYLAISDFTTGISQRDYVQFQHQYDHPLPQARFITFRQSHREIAHLMAEYIRRQLHQRGMTPEQQKEMGLLLGCHGTVIEAPTGIEDTGYCDTKQAFDNVEEELKNEFRSVAIGWLNHRLGGEWTTPTLETSAQTMLEQGIKSFIYFPFGFLADNAETQLEGRVILRGVGIQNYHHLPCMNADPDFIQYLVSLIVEESLRDG